jgi:hypothetical protein
LFVGIVNMVDAWDLISTIKAQRSYKDSFVFFDRNNLFLFADALKHLPIPGNFPTEADYLLEQDRELAKQFVKTHYPSLHIPLVRDFSHITDAKSFLYKTKDCWVVKGRNDDAQTFIPESDDPRVAANQVMQVLESGKETYEKSGFILEKKIATLIELTPEKIYYDGVPVAIVMNLENKPFGGGNTSIQTGCAQDLVFPLSFEDKIHEIAFPPFIDALAKKHKGLFYWDASLLIDKNDEKIYFGEFCANRPGYNQIFTELAQCETVHDYFSAITQKQTPFPVGTYSASVRMFNMNRDLKTEKLAAGIPINNQNSSLKNVWLWDVRQDIETMQSVGYDWGLGVVTGSGKTMEEAVDAVYDNVSHISFNGNYYRPKFDFLSKEYPTSIVNRLEYGEEEGLYKANQ